MKTVFSILFQTTAKKNANDPSPEKHVEKSKTTVTKKLRPRNTTAKNRAPVKPPKTVSFKTKSCRRSLCYSDEEGDDQKEV